MGDSSRGKAKSPQRVFSEQTSGWTEECLWPPAPSLFNLGLIQISAHLLGLGVPIFPSCQPRHDKRISKSLPLP